MQIKMYVYSRCGGGAAVPALLLQTTRDFCFVFFLSFFLIKKLEFDCGAVSKQSTLSRRRAEALWVMRYILNGLICHADGF